jgi:ribosomal protein S18 acetylase RimI-like enzyme
MPKDEIQYRIAAEEDLPQLGDLRWRLQTDDNEEFDVAAHDQYIKDFSSLLEDENNSGQLVHWVAETQGQIIAAMSVRIVNKIPKPSKYGGRWGYLTNVYTLPEYRSRRIGGQLLGCVKNWAKQEQLEMLIVWPSDNAYAFYERSGFRKYPDPLVLDFDKE